MRLKSLLHRSCLLWLLTPSWAAAQEPKFYIKEYRIVGNKRLSGREAGELVYPFLGPGRTPADVEQARLALEKAVHERGFQTVSVTIPDQDPRSGVIRLEITEGTLGRVRVTGAKWFLPSRIRQELPSLAEGNTPDFKQVEREILAVNRSPYRRVKPELKPGLQPGTLDLDLTVEDQIPLTATLEINNRYSLNTSPLRLSGGFTYANLFQAGHTVGLDFQLAPENLDDAFVYSGRYLLPLGDELSLSLGLTRQESDISIVGGAAVAGKGNVASVRLAKELPGSRSLTHQFQVGFDWKDFSEDLTVGGSSLSSPVEYWPVSADYSASWLEDQAFTDFRTGVTLHFRGLGSGGESFSGKRYGADDSFAYWRVEGSRTRDLDGGSQWFARLQGQVASQPLINSEQLAAGGLSTVRGYLEATAMGDDGGTATLEWRTPNAFGGSEKNSATAPDWRAHAFFDAGWVSIRKPLPGQDRNTTLLGVGFGSRFSNPDGWHAAVDLGFPLVDQPESQTGHPRVTFRSWADF